MRKLLVLACLVISAFASADDPSVRAMLQAKYATIDAAMGAGDMRAIATVCDSAKFMTTSIQKQHQTLAQLLKALEQKKPEKFEIKTQVEGADTLAGMAKAALRITSTQIVREKGKAVTYKSIKTQEDTWEQDGDDWKLIESRLTSNLVTRDGKTIVNEREKVLTDWDRQYGHQTSSSRRRHHG